MNIEIGVLIVGSPVYSELKLLVAHTDDHIELKINTVDLHFL